MLKFNTTGPCFPDEHYMLPALDRLPGVRELVAGGNYFVVHAPRRRAPPICPQYRFSPSHFLFFPSIRFISFPATIGAAA